MKNLFLKKIVENPTPLPALDFSTYASSVDVLAVLPESTLIACAANNFFAEDNNPIYLWNYQESSTLQPEPSAILRGHTAGISALAVLPTLQLVSGSLDCTIRIWNTQPEQCIDVLIGHTLGILALTVLSDGRIVSGSMDTSIRIWHFLDGHYTYQQSLFAHTDYVHSLRVLTNGHLASGSSDGKILIWDVNNTAVALKTALRSSNLLALAVLPDDRLISETTDHELQVWDHQRNESIFIAQHQEEICMLIQLPENWLLSGSVDGKIYLWNIYGSATEMIKEEQGRLLGYFSNGIIILEKEQKIHFLDIGLYYRDPAISSHIARIDDLIEKEEEFSAEGSFSTVIKAMWHQSTPVAVKKFRLKRKDQATAKALADFERETELHASLQHLNVVQLYGISTINNKYWMVMEFMENGSLSDFLKEEKTLPWSIRLDIACGFIQGLNYLHQKEIIHRDLKSPNILIGARMNAKIADFGLSQFKTELDNLTTRAMGTLRWMAPELLATAPRGQRRQEPNLTTDVYSAGIILWEIAAKKVPYDDMDEMQVRDHVRTGDREIIPHEIYSLCLMTEIKNNAELAPETLYLGFKNNIQTKIIYRTKSMQYPAKLVFGMPNQSLWNKLQEAIITQNLDDIIEDDKNTLFQYTSKIGHTAFKTPPGFAHLIQRCWAQRAEKRPKINIIAKSLQTIWKNSYANHKSCFERFLKDCKALIHQHHLKHPQCFISYCWGSDKTLHDDLQQKLKDLKRYLEMLGATVFLDVRDLNININQFMNKIEHCDYVFLIGTPSLKSRLEETHDNNLKTEFEKIKLKKSTNESFVWPLIFQGDGDFSAVFKNTLPENFIDRNTNNLLVRDCRHKSDEQINPEGLLPYIKSLCGDGSGIGGALGVIPSIYSINQHHIRDAYSVLYNELIHQIAPTFRTNVSV